MSTTTTSTALDVVSAYHAAWTSGDLDSAIALVADDVVVHAPGEDVIGKEAYREYLGGFLQIMTGHTPLAAFGDDQQAVLFYFPHTPVTQSAPASERFVVSDGKIKESHLVFDRLSYAPPEEAH
ncbi:nuclear transport factor 2 family protein [Naumannella cuiyingiana]|uniref:Ketosteroid isomerase-like protein n=1 Tax=Naumannella cuiyingiana TaxID=1347891 RepID=A0A7Z0D812_9ACTN|nr:ketosteroid isomerase-like protein [Naumannella cuiyingiana]